MVSVSKLTESFYGACNLDVYCEWEAEAVSAGLLMLLKSRHTNSQRERYQKESDTKVETLYVDARCNYHLDFKISKVRKVIGMYYSTLINSL